MRKDRHDIESVREAKGVTFREFKKSKLLEICLTFLTGKENCASGGGLGTRARAGRGERMCLFGIRR
ncbi:MAG: hypothetical protein DMG09_23895 [Acidobacteria bacterium]|nr:MAG: hypothetical protein DMG09_23895 [Acidobacteriota bacterium]